MTPLLLVSAIQLALFGLAMLLLWRQERRYRYVRQWGWSWLLLALGLAGGPLMQDHFASGGVLRALQALLASAALMASQLLQLMGSLDFRGRRLRVALWLPGFVSVMVALAVLGTLHMPSAVLFGGLVLGLGALASALLLWLQGTSQARWVGVCFAAAGLVHATGPLLDPSGRSVLTYGLGAIVQLVLSLALILLSLERAHVEARLQAERFTRLAEHSLQGLVVLRGRELLYANPAALAMFGYADLEAAKAGDVLDVLVAPEQREEARRRHAELVQNPKAHFEWEETRRSRDGRLLHLHGLSSQIVWDGAPAELLALIDDSGRHAALQALRRQALYDDLTELPNRNYALERLQYLTRLGAAPFALVSADIDRFQLVNETLGHAVGDALLQAVAQRLKAELAGEATVARLGEDQFLMLLEGPHAGERGEAQRFVERLLDLLRQPFVVEGAELFVHLSVGVALFPADGSDGAALLRAADAAVHRAKGEPGASYAFYVASMNQAAQARLVAEQALAKALEAGEFELLYQPKFRAGSRELLGFEALVRWQRPGHGQVSPADFVPAAERTGQIQALGALILELATRQLRPWLDRFGAVLPVAINVSPLQFEDARFVPRLLAAIEALDLPRGSLQIEMTESAAIGHVEQVRPQLERLRQAGVLCALDDFGTGQSSLTMLRQLPIHAMKLDRSMIAPLPQDDAGAVVRATCALGQSLGLEVIAEGVETEAQAQAAEALGCTQLQGYHLGRPLHALDAGGLLGTRLGGALSAPSPRPAGSPGPAASPG
jgi:diguanylate cyclase (GGDEF)-like protein/PAS domain S-box-containing protein